jgi:hypothetical protein
MSRHDDRVSLREMLDHIEEAVLLAWERTRADLGTDRVFSLALLKLVEIVCEAGTRVSEGAEIGPVFGLGGAPRGRPPPPIAGVVFTWRAEGERRLRRLSSAGGVR